MSNAAPSCKEINDVKDQFSDCDDPITSKAYHIALTDNTCPNVTRDIVKVSLRPHGHLHVSGYFYKRILLNAFTTCSHEND